MAAHGRHFLIWHSERRGGREVQQSELCNDIQINVEDEDARYGRVRSCRATTGGVSLRESRIADEKSEGSGFQRCATRVFNWLNDLMGRKLNLS